VWLELIVHPVSALVFQGDAPPADLMQRPPRDPRAPMLPRGPVVRSLLSGGLLTAAVLVMYAWHLPGGAKEARGVALATLIAGYQLLVMVERAPSIGRVSELFPRSARFWGVWLASGISLPILMYVPVTAELMNIHRLPVKGWAVALGMASLALGWRIVVSRRSPARK
jgi:Ca2+-transporting ATPase